AVAGDGAALGDVELRPLAVELGLRDEVALRAELADLVQTLAEHEGDEGDHRRTPSLMLPAHPSSCFTTVALRPRQPHGRPALRRAWRDGIRDLGTMNERVADDSTLCTRASDREQPARTALRYRTCR